MWRDTDQGDLRLPPEIDDAASLISPEAATACMRLRQTFVLSESWGNRERPNFAGSDLAETMAGFVATMLIDMHIFDDQCGKDTGVRARLSRGVGPDELAEAAARVRGW